MWSIYKQPLILDLTTWHIKVAQDNLSSGIELSYMMDVYLTSSISKEVCDKDTLCQVSVLGLDLLARTAKKDPTIDQGITIGQTEIQITICM